MVCFENVAGFPVAGEAQSARARNTDFVSEPFGENEDEDVNYEAAVDAYVAHLAEHPDDAGIWFDIGIAYKHLRRWQQCVNANLRALELNPNEPGDPAWWNLGIAATALRDWPLARKAWRGYGLSIDGEEGPVTCAYGMTPVRLPNGEVVWGDSIDPARVIIRNVPFRDSGFRWGDIVLRDGAPNGERRSGTQTYSVFNVLEKWSPSEIPTYAVTVTCGDASDSEALVKLFEEQSFAAEDWTANVRTLCAACSRGNPDAQHTHAFKADATEREFGIAAPRGLAEKLLARWASGARGRSYGALEAS